MTQATAEMATARTGRLTLRPVLLALAALTVLAVGAERLILALAQPLWLDETWTAAIVSAPGWRGFGRELWLDVNAPLYYGLMRLWTGAFGVSDLALKVPGLIAAALAAALPLAWRRSPLSFEARLTWAVLLFAWWGADNFLDARCYGLLFALTVLQCTAFARLMAAPGRRAALAWCVLASLSILTQYYAVFLAAAQGLAYLAVHRKRAVTTWPAALAFLPAFGWIAWHAPRLAQFAGGGVAWHERLTPAAALDLAAFPVGPAVAAFLAMLALVLGAASLASRLSPAAADEPAADLSALWWVAASGLFALAVVLASGMLRPTLVGRYLIPEAPPLLLGVVLCARSLRRSHMAYAALIALYAAVAVRPPAAVAAAARDTSAYGLELASDRLAAQGVTDLVFIWDHPAVRIMDPGSLRAVGGFFLARAGHPAAVMPLYVNAARDPNLQALAAARGAKPGIIWIYDRTGRTAAHRFAPAIAQADPRWSCQTFGDGTVGSVACWRPDRP
jgi:uncharacterized membrane protein